MPLGPSILRAGPFRPVNTLSDPSNRAPLQSPFSHNAAKRSRPKSGTPDFPTPKRTKTEYTQSRLAGAAEYVEESDNFSRTEPCGSQGSASVLMAEGVSEYRNVESGSKSHKRTPRHGSRLATKPAAATLRRSYNEVENDEIMDADEDDVVDQLVPGNRVSPRAHRRSSTATSGSRARTTGVGGDASDTLFYKGGHSRSARIGTGEKRRTKAQVLDDDIDELGEDDPALRGKRALTSRLTNGARSSVSRKADIPPTQWAKKHRLDPEPQDAPTNDVGVPVKTAFCTMDLEYKAPTGEKSGVQCFLRPNAETQLRAYTYDGQRLQEYAWIRITDQAKSLCWNPRSPIISVTQPRDARLGTAGKLMLRLHNAADAVWVKDWIQKSLPGIIIREELDEKLDKIYKKFTADVRAEAARRGGNSNRVSLNSGTLDMEPIKPGMIEASLEQSRAAMPPPVAPGSRGRLLLRERMLPPEKDIVHSDVHVLQDAPVRSDIEVLPDRPDHSDVEVLPDKRATRRSQRNRAGGGQPLPIDSSPRWTEQHPEWDKEWSKPLVLGRTMVEKDDIPRLDEGQCLNDNIIGYALRVLFDTYSSASPDLAKRVYVHNTFFYEKLTSDRSYKGKINYEGVKNWTSKVDLLAYDYVIVPVNEHYHWWLAIICHPGRLDPDAPRPPMSVSIGTHREQPEPSKDMPPEVEVTDVVERRPFRSPGESAAAELSCLSIGSPKASNRALDDDCKEDRVVNLVDGDTVEITTVDTTRRSAKRGRKSSGPPPRVYDPQEPRIITLDSLGTSHSNSVTCLKHYLAAEFEHKRQKIIEPLPQQLGMKATNIPEQDNFCDCGVYLLGYVHEFFKSPDRFVQLLLQRESPKWNFNPPKLRNIWREEIFKRHSKSHGKDSPQPRPEPLPPMPTTELANKAQDETAHDKVKPGTSPDSKSSIFNTPAEKPQSARKCVERGPAASSAPSPSVGGPQKQELLKQKPSDRSPKQKSAPGAWPTQDGSADEVSLLQPFEEKKSHKNTLVEKVDSWLSSKGPVKFIPKLRSSPTRSDAQSVEELIKEVSEEVAASNPPKPLLSAGLGKRGDLRKESSEDLEEIQFATSLAPRSPAAVDKRSSARRDSSGDLVEIKSSRLFAPEAPAAVADRSVPRQSTAVSMAPHTQARFAAPVSAPTTHRVQAEIRPLRRKIPAVEFAELVRPEAIDLTEDEPGVV
ncbi:hypothetical protein B0T16DRAFT_85317 [Cercophora newfieldiana]|uniref:Ubiquitin-like protease family profile domain-containing protein n=1 Tax=Cercophora newfieldiana TaxID=92897 RepID=A0AA39YHQ6_9PEZI|nr:hypothetical protein B0T16DRAFT_85317 [Cercophora newfieldiana]